MGYDGVSGADPQLYAHGVAGVQPEWIERVAGDQVSRRYHEPRDARRGEVIANEQVTYLGLVLSANRRVQYARVNALDARAIFIQEGLVDGQVQKRPPFLEANLELIEEVRELERSCGVPTCWLSATGYTSSTTTCCQCRWSACERSTSG